MLQYKLSSLASEITATQMHPQPARGRAQKPFISIKETTKACTIEQSLPTTTIQGSALLLQAPKTLFPQNLC